MGGASNMDFIVADQRFQHPAFSSLAPFFPTSAIPEQPGSPEQREASSPGHATWAPPESQAPSRRDAASPRTSLLRNDAAAPLLGVCTGEVTPVSKDGSCLFSAALHELKRLLIDKGGHAPPSERPYRSAYGMLAFHSAYGLRQQTAAWIAAHAEDTFGGLKLHEWIEAETGESVEQYCQRMRLPTEWGGVIELFAIAQLFGVSVWVYETARNAGLYAPGRAAVACMRRTHVLEPTAAAAGGAACLLYNGINHYDVFTPAIGPSLRRVGLFAAAGAEYVRRSHQLQRCSEDLDLSCFAPGARPPFVLTAAAAPSDPPTKPPLPSPPLRGGGGFSAAAAASLAAPVADEPRVGSNTAGTAEDAARVAVVAPPAIPALALAGRPAPLAAPARRRRWAWRGQRQLPAASQDVRV